MGGEDRMSSADLPAPIPGGMVREGTVPPQFFRTENTVEDRSRPQKTTEDRHSIARWHPTFSPLANREPDR
jgi:hypothetical protein